MKNFVALLLLSSLCALSQETDTIAEYKPKYNDTDKRAVVAIKNDNIVYRGIDNKIHVAVAGVDAWDTMISVPGSLRKSFEMGEYKWNVTSVPGNAANITVTYRLADGSSKQEQIEFEIKNLRPLRSLINGNGDYNCVVQQTLEQLKDAQISVVSDDMVDGLRDIHVRRFEIHCDKAVYTVEGNKIINAVYEELKKLKPGSVFYIRRIGFVSKLPVDFTSDIKVMIVE